MRTGTVCIAPPKLCGCIGCCMPACIGCIGCIGCAGGLPWPCCGAPAPNMRCCPVPLTDSSWCILTSATTLCFSDNGRQRQRPGGIAIGCMVLRSSATPLHHAQQLSHAQPQPTPPKPRSVLAGGHLRLCTYSSSVRGQCSLAVDPAASWHVIADALMDT